MSRTTIIELDKDYLKFSAAHFTIFSETERERMHGHNFKVTAHFHATVGDNGMCVDYSELKKKVLTVCQRLDEYTIIPSESPYLRVEEEGDYYHLHFNHEVIILLKSDTLLLPVKNTTVEEYSWYILQQLLEDSAMQMDCGLLGLDIWVSSGPGQKGLSSWRAK